MSAAESAEASNDWYALLQVSPTAEREVIDAAYRRLSLKYHPDRNGEPAAAEYMCRINAAYAVLSDPALKAAYDRERAERTQSAAAADSGGRANGKLESGREAWSQLSGVVFKLWLTAAAIAASAGLFVAGSVLSKAPRQPDWTGQVQLYEVPSGESLTLPAEQAEAKFKTGHVQLPVGVPIIMRMDMTSSRDGEIWIFQPERAQWALEHGFHFATRRERDEVAAQRSEDLTEGAFGIVASLLVPFAVFCWGLWVVRRRAKRGTGAS